jgi:hypothetical protein
LAAVEAETKSDHEKLMDVLDSYKARKSQIGKAALENCALEQLDWNKCMKSGDWTARMTMCRAEVRKFERCYATQSVGIYISLLKGQLLTGVVNRGYSRPWATYRVKTGHQKSMRRSKCTQTLYTSE